MYMQILKKNNQAFTIIEVLIVLSIVGLIMLIVFLAVPALQRNSRNTQRKHDVVSLLAAVNEYSGNHDGALPTGFTVQFNAPSAFVETNPKLGYYADSAVLWLHNTIPSSSANTIDVDHVDVESYEKCDTDPANPGGTTATGASSHTIVILYSLETANGTPSPQCKGS